MIFKNSINWGRRGAGAQAIPTKRNYMFNIYISWFWYEGKLNMQYLKNSKKQSVLTLGLNLPFYVHDTTWSEEKWEQIRFKNH